MILSINSPAYFSKEYGVDNEVYNICRDIRIFVKEKKYSEKVETIGIVPVVAPKELTDQGAWKEEIEYDLKFNAIYITRRIDFEKYRSANINEKKILIVKNILEAVKKVHKKGKIDYQRFEDDILEFLGYKKSDLDI